MKVSALWREFVAYVDGADKRLRLAGTVAFVVASNQPFYPLYVWWIAGRPAALASLVTWFSTAFFAAVPAVGRRRPTTGKILLLVAGIGNTALCSFVLGTAGGVELFYLPCLVLAATLFNGRAKWWALAIGGAFVAVALMLARKFDVAVLSPAESASLFRLHAASVAGLVAVIAYRLWKDRRG